MPEPGRAERPLPFTPADVPRDRTLARAVTAHAVCCARGYDYPGDIARELWPKDAVTHALIQRAASAPASATQSGWASQLGATAVASFIGTLTDSAAAALIAAAPQFSLAHLATMTLPRAASLNSPGWIAEGAPVPVAQGAITSPTLGPVRKLGLIETMSREVGEASAGDAEQAVSLLLTDAMRAQLDQSIFSATAASSTQPAGILNGLVGLTATTGGGLGAAIGDVRLLADAVAAGGGGGSPMFFTSSGRALALKAYLDEAGADRVHGSAYIGSGVLICVDPRGFASSWSSDPQIEASIQATLHYEDTSPQQIGTAGSPNVVAAPSRSLFQTDVVALRCIVRGTWAMRVPAVSFISTGLSW